MHTGLNFRHISSGNLALSSTKRAGRIRYPDAGHIENPKIRLVLMTTKAVSN